MIALVSLRCCAFPPQLSEIGLEDAVYDIFFNGVQIVARDPLTPHCIAQDMYHVNDRNTCRL